MLLDTSRFLVSTVDVNVKVVKESGSYIIRYSLYSQVRLNINDQLIM